jgi:hypothetical protein
MVKGKYESHDLYLLPRKTFENIPGTKRNLK